MSKVCVLGVFNADLKFSVERMPRVGESLRARSFRIEPGGKGFNQAVAARRAGADVSLLSQVGDDTFADLARKVLARENISDQHLLTSERMPTGTALILLLADSGDNAIVVAPGAASLLTPADLDRFTDTIAAAQVFVTNLEVPLDVAIHGLRIARQHGVTTLLDPAPAAKLPSEAYSLCDYLTPNETEAAALTGHTVANLEDAARAGQMLRAHGAATILVTLGSNGLMAVSAAGSQHLPAMQARQVVDTTGAGDAFNGCFATALAEGAELVEALRWGSAGAALSVTAQGAADSMPTREAIEAKLRG